MTPSEIRETCISAIYASWTETPVAWPNRDFDPAVAATNDEWLRPIIKMGDTFEGEKGEDGVGLRTGVLFVDIFVGKGKGNKNALAYAAKIERLFRKKNLDNVIFDEASTNDIGVYSASGGQTIGDSPYYQVQVKVPFWAWVGE